MENTSQNPEPSKQSINNQVPSVDNLASRRPLIPVSFTLVIICFFFSFFLVKCGGQKIGSVSGFDLVTGTHLKSQDLFSGEEEKGEKVPANAWAIIALGAAVVGLGVFLMRHRKEAIFGTLAGGIGFGSLIILQFAIRNAIEEKTANQVETSFQFGYWAALILFAIAAILSYLRWKKFPEKSASAQSNATSQGSVIESQEQSPVAFQNPLRNIDIGPWFKRNFKLIILVVLAIVGIYLIYYFLLRNDPEKDARNAEKAYCDCQTLYNEALIIINRNFDSTFNSFQFKKRQEARDKLAELHNPANDEYSQCIAEAQQKYSKLRGRYLTKNEKLEIFDRTYSYQETSCKPTNQNMLIKGNSLVDDKIESIRDPEPDIEKIKSDLIGNSIPGWKFDNLHEFDSASIINTIRGSERIEYSVKFHLKDTDSGHDCEVIVVYLQGDQGWYFNNVLLQYITYTNIAPVNEWEKIFPLRDTRYSILDQGHNYWVKDGYYGRKHEGGPGKSFDLTSREIYIMSRESEPVELIFKYFPK
ncbi:MAG: hypothetical protein FJY10_11535 [Bacteroidetes bacterium]|nr:hypothetical protein [Bacteroidota bacterium]